MRKSKGFTFIELCLSLAIIGTIVLYTAPSYKAVQEELQTQSFYHEFDSEIDKVRLNALERKEETTILFQINSFIVKSESKPNGVTHPYPKNILFKSSSFTNDEMTFLTDGSPFQSGKIIFYKEGSLKEITLEIAPATGRVKRK